MAPAHTDQPPGILSLQLMQVGRYQPKYQANMKSYGMPRKDAADKDDWRWRIEGATG